MKASIPLLLSFLLASSSAFASKDSLVTAVFSSVSNGYTREKLPDGTFKRETYVVANGGAVAGTLKNSAAEEIPFPALVRLLAGFLARENYAPTRDPESADLLLVLSWGKTIPYNAAPEDAATAGMFSARNDLRAANEAVQIAGARGQALRNPESTQSPTGSIRDAAADVLEGQLSQMQLFDGIRTKTDERNANLLGYTREINAQNNLTRFAGNGDSYDDLIADIENPRYYLIISAYDYRVAVKERKSKVLWVTRVSIQTQGNRFDASLAAMLANASRHFGQDSGHLIRQYQSNGWVNLGELKILGTVPQSSLPEQPSPGK